MDKAHEAKVTFTKISSSLVITSTKVDGGLTDTKVRVPGPGTLTQKATRRSNGRTVTACVTAPKRKSRAGDATLKCRQTAATRAARRKGPVAVRVCTTFTPDDGQPSTRCRRVVLSSTKPNFTG